MVGLFLGFGLAAGMVAANAASPCPNPCGWIGRLLGASCITSCGASAEVLLFDFLALGVLFGMAGMFSGVAADVVIRRRGS